MLPNGGPTMLSGTCIEPGRFMLVDRPMPVDAPAGWVLVDIGAVGLCGTDFHIFAGKHPYLEYPRVIGHELGGTVAQSQSGWEQGQRVVINPYLSCGTCRACVRAKPNCCTSISVLGVHRDGGMCARIAVPQGNLYKADGLSLHEAAMVEFLAIGAHAVRRSELTAGDCVLVMGAGPIGLGTALFARLAGAEVHLQDASAARLQSAKRNFGFDNLHGIATPLLTGKVADGFDVVFDATGNATAMQAGFANVAHGGTYVLVSVVKDDICFNDAEFHKREMRLVGSRNATEQDFHTVMDAIRAGHIAGAKIVSAVIGLNDLASRFPDLANDRENLTKVIVDFASAGVQA